MKRNKKTLIEEQEEMKEAFNELKTSIKKELKNVLVKLFPNYKKYLKIIYIVLQLIFIFFMTCLLIKIWR